MDAVIGRGPQRAWLEEAVAEAATGRGSLVLLGGDAGVGKTRLVEEVASTAHGTFLRGAARPSSPPYCSVVTALRRYLQKLPDGLEGCAPLRDLPVLTIAAYRSDEIPRGHPVRRLRTELRRDRLLRELVLEPLSSTHAT